MTGASTPSTGLPAGRSSSPPDSQFLQNNTIVIIPGPEKALFVSASTGEGTGFW
jgi:hypothetical protein